VSAVPDYLPRDDTLTDEAFRQRHLLLQWVLVAFVVLVALVGLVVGHGIDTVAATLVPPMGCLAAARVVPQRWAASSLVVAGLVYCAAAVVALSDGSIAAHFLIFIVAVLAALYQAWAPFGCYLALTTLGYVIGAATSPELTFEHAAGRESPWTWAFLHVLAVLAVSAAIVAFWKSAEDEQDRSLSLAAQLSEAEINRRRFTSQLLVNLARRNQQLLSRQLDLLGQLENTERDPDVLADLFRLDHLATQIRRNAESLLVISGEEPARKWGRPVLLVDVVRAAVAEIEELDRVDVAVNESVAVSGRAVSDLTHLLAELIENAVHASPSGLSVMLRTRPYLPPPGGQVLTIEDWGVGMGQLQLAEANALLREPRDIDLSVSHQLGLHVVARLAARYGIAVSLTPTPGGGITAAAVLPTSLFADAAVEPVAAPALGAAARRDVDAPLFAGSFEMGALVPPPTFAGELGPAPAPAPAPVPAPAPAQPLATVAPVNPRLPPGAPARSAGAAQAIWARAVEQPAMPARNEPARGSGDSAAAGWDSWWTPHRPPDEESAPPADGGTPEPPAAARANVAGQDTPSQPAGAWPSGPSTPPPPVGENSALGLSAGAVPAAGTSGTGPTAAAANRPDAGGPAGGAAAGMSPGASSAGSTPASGAIPAPNARAAEATPAGATPSGPPAGAAARGGMPAPSTHAGVAPGGAAAGGAPERGGIPGPGTAGMASAGLAPGGPAAGGAPERGEIPAPPSGRSGGQPADGATSSDEAAAPAEPGGADADDRTERASWQ
jgi:signal transduction histidine kinase